MPLLRFQGICGMLIRNVAVAFAVLAGAASLPMTANAATINFSDLNSGSCAYAGSPATSQGFTFTDLSGGGLFLCNAGVIQNNTTPALIAANVLSILGMTAEDNGLFSLQSFSAGGRTQDFNPNIATGSTASGVEVVGVTAGGTVTQSFDFNGLQFSNFALNAGFTGLSSVRFTALGSPNAEFLINNIEVNGAGGAVPEPATWALMIMGFGGAGAMVRRRKAVLA